MTSSKYADNALNAALFMTTARSNEFNAIFPDGKRISKCGEGAAKVKGVGYYSWGGSDT
jgi:triacylglycerol lipase